MNSSSMTSSRLKLTTSRWDMIICCVVVTPMLPCVLVVIVRSSEDVDSVSPVSVIVSVLEDVEVLDLFSLASDVVLPDPVSVTVVAVVLLPSSEVVDVLVVVLSSDPVEDPDVTVFDVSAKASELYAVLEVVPVFVPELLELLSVESVPFTVELFSVVTVLLVVELFFVSVVLLAVELFSAVAVPLA